MYNPPGQPSGSGLLRGGTRALGLSKGKQCPTWGAWGRAELGPRTCRQVPEGGALHGEPASPPPAALLLYSHLSVPAKKVSLQESSRDCEPCFSLRTPEWHCHSPAMWPAPFGDDLGSGWSSLNRPPLASTHWPWASHLPLQFLC